MEANGYRENAYCTHCASQIVKETNSKNSPSKPVLMLYLPTSLKNPPSYQCKKMSTYAERISCSVGMCVSSKKYGYVALNSSTLLVYDVNDGPTNEYLRFIHDRSKTMGPVLLVSWENTYKMTCTIYALFGIAKFVHYKHLLSEKIKSFRLP
ncbi:hypothetical protein RhiirB3_426826 [Rhizophagus irregularis]|nr:hypothetical protein RhiirB3_426826 [Rhizophagus irregularis]